jgi:hypothetical protein
MTSRIATTALVLSSVLTAAAGGIARADAPPKEVQDMSCLIGTWKVKGTMAMGPQKASIAGSWKCGWLPSKWGVQCDFEISGVPGMPAYQERDLMGFEPNTHKYHWYAVTNAGETHDHVGDVPTGNDARFVYEGTQGGKPMREVIDFHFAADGKSLHVKSETFVGGASVAVLEGDGHK